MLGVVHESTCDPSTPLTPTHLHPLQLISFGVMIMSAWALSQFADFKQLISAQSLLVLAFCGLFIFLVAILGCAGTLWQMRWALFLYAFLVFVLTCCVLGAAVALMLFAGKLGSAATGLSAMDPVVNEIQSFVNCSYNYWYETESERV